MRSILFAAVLIDARGETKEDTYSLTLIAVLEMSDVVSTAQRKMRYVDLCYCVGAR